MVGAAVVRYYLGIGAGAACDPYKTFPLKAYHSAVLRAMIDRDKNHPCVVPVSYTHLVFLLSRPV